MSLLFHLAAESGDHMTIGDAIAFVGMFAAMAFVFWVLSR